MEGIDEDYVSEDFLLKIVPENDPIYGGSREKALENARRIYDFYKQEINDIQKEIGRRTLNDKDLIGRICENSNSEEIHLSGMLALYRNKEFYDDVFYSP